MGSVLVLLTLILVFSCNEPGSLVAGKTTAVIQKGKKEKQQKEVDVAIVKRWELPRILREVSGIAYIDQHRFACIQDEDGVIFIYNRTTQQIEKEIPFAPPGDYEGITLKNQTAYVVRSDGRLYEVPLQEGRSGVKEWTANLTAAHNVEGLFYDKDKNRLLLAIKNREPHTNEYKGIYAFELGTHTFINEPVYKLQLKDDPVLNSGKTIKPSAIAIHPRTKEIYVVDGPSARLLVLSAAGQPKKFYNLGDDFAQAEGITFSPSGDLFISNEGKKKGNIIQLTLQ